MTMTPQLTRYVEALHRHQAALEELADATEDLGQYEGLMLGGLTTATAVRRTFAERLARYPAVIRLESWRRWRGTGAAG